MSQPSVTLTERDGALGILPPSAGKIPVYVGVADSGTVNAPATFGRVKDLTAAFGGGPTVEAAARSIGVHGQPVCFIRATTATAGAYVTSSIDVSGVTGTSVIAATGSAANDDYEVVILFIAGGTRGVAGITYKYSLDGGRTYSPTQALGTATSIVIPSSGSVTATLAAGTIVAGDVVTFRTAAPIWDTTGLTAALTALQAWIGTWKDVRIVGDVNGAAFDAIETAMTTMDSAGKPRAWIGNTRMPLLAESEATYKSALDTIFSAKATTRGYLHSGSCEYVSSVNGRRYRRPAADLLGALQMSVSEEVNIAWLGLGALVGATITDDNGNPKHHDESVNPGLDDSRFSVLRTWEGRAGVYANKPRIFSAEGSDFDIAPKREVMNIAKIAVRAYLETRLNAPILVDTTTGYILEEEAVDIETGANAALSATLLAKPKASGATFVLSRTDNLLSTRTMNGQTRIVPLAYAEAIVTDIAFENPALQVVAV